MTLTRLLAAALLLCSLSAFGQNQHSQISPPSMLTAGVRSTEGVFLGEDFFSLNLNASATPTERWGIFPGSQSLVVSGQTRRDQTPLDQPKLEFRVRRLLEGQLERLREEGPTCYAIRSFVVERDSKDSDSTHLAGYSTCQPATRYEVKTIQVQPEPADR